MLFKFLKGERNRAFADGTNPVAGWRTDSDCYGLDGPAALKTIYFRRHWGFCLDNFGSWHNPDVGTYSGWQRLKSSVLGSYSLKCFEINRILHRNCRRQLRTPAILLVSRRDRFS